MAVEDLYWNSIDFGSEESIPNMHQKHYVDPWDLENYAYIRQHLDSLDLSSDPSSLGDRTESNSSSFYYTPATARNVSAVPRRYESFTSEHGNSNYAAIEDVKRPMPLRYFGQDPQLSLMENQRRDMDSFESEIEESPYEESNRDSSLLYIYETRSRCRRIAMPSSKPSRERSLSFSYGDHTYDTYRPKHNVYARPEEIYSHYGRAPTSPVYDCVKNRIPNRNNFGLTNYGHLKIDYSCNWNTLDKYIYS